jgi:hypothetical protein
MFSHIFDKPKKMEEVFFLGTMFFFKHFFKKWK